MTHKQFNRLWFNILIIAILFLLVGIANAAVRPEPPPSVQTHLTTVCLDGSVVVECPQWGDLNYDGEVNLGDLLLLQRRILGLI